MTAFVEQRPRIVALAMGVGFGLVTAAVVLDARADSRHRDGPAPVATGHQVATVVATPNRATDLIDVRDRIDETTGSMGPETPAAPSRSPCVVGCIGPTMAPVASLAAMQIDPARPSVDSATVAVTTATDVGAVIECIAGCYAGDQRTFRATGGPAEPVVIATLVRQPSERSLASAATLTKPVKIKTAHRTSGKTRHARSSAKAKRRAALARARSAKAVVIAKASAVRQSTVVPAARVVSAKPKATPLVIPAPRSVAVAPESHPVAPGPAAATPVVVEATETLPVASDTAVEPATDAPVAAVVAPAPAAPAKRTMVTTDWFNRINRDRAAKSEADAAVPTDD